MSYAHILYIPATIMLGLAIGYIMGARAVRTEMAKLKRRAKE